MADKNFEQSIKELEENTFSAPFISPATFLIWDNSASLKLFENGVKLTKNCQKMLDDAEKKVSVLMATDSGELVDFTGEGE